MIDVYSEMLGAWTGATGSVLLVLMGDCRGAPLGLRRAGVGAGCVRGGVVDCCVPELDSRGIGPVWLDIGANKTGSLCVNAAGGGPGVTDREDCCAACVCALMNRSMCLLRSVPLLCGQNMASKSWRVCSTRPSRPSSGSWPLHIEEDYIVKIVDYGYEVHLYQQWRTMHRHCIQMKS